MLLCHQNDTNKIVYSSVVKNNKIRTILYESTEELLLNQKCNKNIST